MRPESIKVPEGMLKAAMGVHRDNLLTPYGYEAILEDALRWLSENPIVPTDEQAANMIGGNVPSASSMYCKQGAVEWQRQMFLASDSEMPEEIKDFIWKGDRESIAQTLQRWEVETHNHQVIEAFKRGQRR